MPVVLVGIFYLGVFGGMHEGRNKERQRCCDIIERALQVRFSPTMREALVCIASNQTSEEMEQNLKEICDAKEAHL